MEQSKITVIAGTSGSGKTTWIHQKLNKINPNSTSCVLYFSPEVGSTPIDAERLAAEFPFLKVFYSGQEAEFTQLLESADAAFIELGFYLNIAVIEQILNNQNYHKIAIVASQSQESEYHTWASEIIENVGINANPTEKQLLRIQTTGEVVDENSIYEVWYEISQGAYGNITRAKGIFDVADGRSLYGDFVAGIQPTPFLELDLPRHLEGRPQRFSGLEVVGKFEETALKQTLENCCLSDAMISHYQQQVKQDLMQGVEA
ncbi:hypothetical protein CAL7716_053710 [Calothrix sp. PCC 7716]|nr:hypothetical protein CAL7716_053710 [Calothrix sp. PCC 7716]